MQEYSTMTYETNFYNSPYLNYDGSSIHISSPHTQGGLVDPPNQTVTKRHLKVNNRIKHYENKLFSRLNKKKSQKASTEPPKETHSSLPTELIIPRRESRRSRSRSRSLERSYVKNDPPVSSQLPAYQYQYERHDSGQTPYYDRRRSNEYEQTPSQKFDNNQNKSRNRRSRSLERFINEGNNRNMNHITTSARSLEPSSKSISQRRKEIGLIDDLDYRQTSQMAPVQSPPQLKIIPQRQDDVRLREDVDYIQNTQTPPMEDLPAVEKRVTFEDDLPSPEEPRIKDKREYVDEFVDNNDAVDTHPQDYQAYSNQYADVDRRRRDFAESREDNSTGYHSRSQSSIISRGRNRSPQKRVTFVDDESSDISSYSEKSDLSIVRVPSQMSGSWKGSDRKSSIKKSSDVARKYGNSRSPRESKVSSRHDDIKSAYSSDSEDISIVEHNSNRNRRSRCPSSYRCLEDNMPIAVSVLLCGIALALA